MIILDIVYKNLRVFFRNSFIIIFTFISPLFILSMINMVSNSEQEIGDVYSKVVITLTNTHQIPIINTFSIGILVQFIFIAAVLASVMLIDEKENQTLLRIKVSPVSQLSILVGNILSHTLLIVFITFVIMFFTSILFGVNWGSISELAIVTIFAAVVADGLGLFVVTIFKSSKYAGTIMSLVIIVMTLASGSLSNGQDFGIVSKLTINKWLYDAYLMVMNGEGIQQILFNLLIVTIISVILFSLSFYLQRREYYYE